MNGKLDDGNLKREEVLSCIKELVNPKNLKEILGSQFEMIKPESRWYRKSSAKIDSAKYVAKSVVCDGVNWTLWERQSTNVVIVSYPLFVSGECLTTSVGNVTLCREGT